MTDEALSPRLLGRTWDAFESAIAAQSSAWPHGDVDATWLAMPDFEHAVLHTPVCRDGTTDLVLVITDWLPQLVADGSLLPLDALVEAAPPADWPEGWSASMRDLNVVDGRRYAMAYHDGPELLLYRADLFDDPEEQRGYAARHGRALAPPRTWAEFTEQAIWFTRPEQGLWGTSMGGFPDGHNNVYDFLLQLWSRGGELVDSDDQPLLDSPAGRDALGYLDRLWNDLGVCDPEGKQRDSVQSGQDFAAGRAALAVNWAGMASMSADPESPTHGRVRCAPIPAVEEGGSSPSLNVFWALAVTAGARDPASAWDFVRHAAGPEMDRLTSLNGCVGTRLSTWRDPAIRATSPAYAAIEEVHRNVRSMPPTVRLPQIVQVLNEMVDDAINRRSAVPEALSRAAQRIGNLRGP